MKPDLIEGFEKDLREQEELFDMQTRQVPAGQPLPHATREVQPGISYDRERLWAWKEHL